jgi:hypothetical protein
LLLEAGEGGVAPDFEARDLRYALILPVAVEDEVAGALTEADSLSESRRKRTFSNNCGDVSKESVKFVCHTDNTKRQWSTIV